MRNARTFTRLVWFHVPLRLTPKTQEEIDAQTKGEGQGKGEGGRGAKEVRAVMREKRMALDLVDG